MGREVAATLVEHGLQVDVYLTSGPNDACAAARGLNDTIDFVVSVGGDGTLREVLTGLKSRPSDARPVPVGVFPMGTGNALGTDLGLPKDPRRAAEMMLAAKTVDIDVADVNGELSFLLTGIGPDAHVVADVDAHRHGKALTKFAYVPAGIRCFLRYRKEPLSVEIDGEKLQGTFSQVMASNLIHYGGLVKLCPERVLDDGKFEIFLFRGHGRLRLIAYTLRFFLGMIPGGSVELRLAKRVRVTSDHSVPYHVDGDPMGKTPVDIEVTGTRFQILVP